ncbi:signal peptide peptidase SppA [Salsuginibacillus kocurii]|uniref:signal peptide peptidase SppA n=1 Tax=Salsuginibacillus kocurii TaxID=427078 RepID=UPI00036B7129|nr:signal peptide peptidase SppA [Salsuginibacillus kocurii]
MNRKRWLALLLAGLLIFVSLGFQTFASITAGALGDGFQTGDDEISENQIGDESGPGKIAVLEINGMIQDTGELGMFSGAGYNHREFLRSFDQAMADDSVDGIVIRVNSQGGGVVESAEIHDRVIESQEEHGIPVHVSMGSMAASGGYYLAAGAEQITAHEGTITGSIGVIMQHIDASGLAEDLGIELDSITSGPYKDITNPTADLEDDERDILQSMVDDLYQDFLEVVMEGRDFSENEVGDVADGRIFSGNQALENGLVDNLGTLEDTLDNMREELDIPNARAVEYEQHIGFNTLFQLGAQQLIGDDLTVLAVQELLGDHGANRPMYLYQEGS